MRQGQGVIHGSKLQEGWTSPLLDLCNDGALPTMITCLVPDMFKRSWELTVGWGLDWMSSWITFSSKSQIWWRELRQWWVCEGKARDKLLGWESHHDPGRHISWGLFGNYFLDWAGWGVVCTSVICSCPSSYLFLFISPIGIHITLWEQRLFKPDKVFPSREVNQQ